ncbi:MAG: phosphatidate cytidylyltransferase [Bryobacterales bacterium]|nr:phosphatidate cytidylyltransferase [Bryobacterales bacterium]
MPIVTELIWTMAGVTSALVAASVAGHALARRAQGEHATAFARNWRDRVNSWWWMCAVAALAMVAGTPLLLLLFAAISLLALREFLSVASSMPEDRYLLLLAFYVLFPMQYSLLAAGQLQWAVTAIPVFCALWFVVRLLRSGRRHPWVRSYLRISSGLLVCVYGLSFPMAVAMANGSGVGVRATLQLLFLLVVSQASDVFQFVVGKLAGKRRIAPRISPSKTVAGLLGGLMGAPLLGAGMWWLTPYPAWLAATLALLVAAAGFAGGLLLSAAKRARGIKDWGTLLPGHGGILDRVDSLWLSAPLYYFAIRWLPLP